MMMMHLKHKTETSSLYEWNVIDKRWKTLLSEGCFYGYNLKLINYCKKPFKNLFFNLTQRSQKLQRSQNYALPVVSPSKLCSSDHHVKLIAYTTCDFISFFCCCSFILHFIYFSYVNLYDFIEPFFVAREVPSRKNFFMKHA